MSDKELLLLAYKAATKSPDPSTQNGAVIPYAALDHVENTIEKNVSACNEFPPGVQYLPERLERPLKYSFIEHAERNVIFKAAAMGLVLTGKTMYVPWFACADCARAIICSGITRVVGHQRMLDATPDHWKESIAHAMTMLKEAGIQLDLIPDVLHGPQIRFNGKIWTP